ncbi:hypothetical protein [[Mycoplasma] gypis]|uniref:DUF5671 domain-containing protein n=1 Tax=[Mycoplasma] gypis TaxID=92404 RepID=A0ABZ2RQI1_9BACT|nr:hypothetical protein [[Mycoplasma] gypis]MBN0919645.1 hypothetical protein [[Mycoplasma] gypis]
MKFSSLRKINVSVLIFSVLCLVALIISAVFNSIQINEFSANYDNSDTQNRVFSVYFIRMYPILISLFVTGFIVAPITLYVTNYWYLKQRQIKMKALKSLNLLFVSKGDKEILEAKNYILKTNSLYKRMWILGIIAFAFLIAMIVFLFFWEENIFENNNYLADVLKDSQYTSAYDVWKSKVVYSYLVFFAMWIFLALTSVFAVYGLMPNHKNLAYTTNEYIAIKKDN